LTLVMVYLFADSHPSKYQVPEPLDSDPTGSRTNDLTIASPTY